MKKNSYDQFFKKAGEVRRDPSAPIRANTKRPQAPRVQAKPRVRPAPPAFKPKAKNSASVPWRAVFGMIVTLFVAGTYLVYPEVFENLLSKVEITAFGEAKAADPAPAEKSQPPPAKGEKSAASGTKKVGAEHGEDKAAVKEDLSHFEKLRQRKEELDAREKELAELEEELRRQKVELDKRLAQLDEMRNQIAQTLKDRVEVDQEKVNKLVELYSNMKPKQAAEVIGSINEDLAVEILAKMKKKNAAEVMNLLPPEKSRVLSEKYMGYRRLASEPRG